MRGYEDLIAEAAPFVTAYLVLAGLTLGSFINLAADRLPRGESVVTPRSHCRTCGRTLNVVDLLPVLGYVLRRGRCATCRAPIGTSAPVVEAVSGGLVAAAIFWQGLWAGAITGLSLVAVFGVLVVAIATSRYRRGIGLEAVTPGSPPGRASDSEHHAR